MRVLLSSVAGLLVCAFGGSQQAQPFVEYPLPFDADPGAITPGPGPYPGLSLWFTEASGIGAITLNGVVTNFPLGSGSRPSGITSGPDTNLWFTESIFDSLGSLVATKIGRMTITGVVTEFPLSLSNSNPAGITAGPDGNLWFADAGVSNVIGRVTTAGVVTTFQIPTRPSPCSPLGCSSGTAAITAGPDGNLWFAESATDKIGRITTAGVITEFPLPATGSGPYAITAGPDGALWFTEQLSRRIGRITTAGGITEFPITSGNTPAGITQGLDGNLWFVEMVTDPGTGVVIDSRIGRMTTAGVITEFPAGPGVTFTPNSIATALNGTLWFTAFTSVGAGYSTDSSSIRVMGTTPDRLCLGDRFCAQVTWQSSSQGGGPASGIAYPITLNTGAFWFLSSDNLEIVIKVLDGRGVNGHFWLFYGSMTDVEFTLTVTDTQTGTQKIYTNQQGQLVSVADTSAF
jgi:virginiamycin B lyase